MVIMVITSMIFVIFLFFQICGVLQNHPQENLTMFWL
jgi:hypothetical protein